MYTENCNRILALKEEKERPQLKPFLSYWKMHASKSIKILDPIEFI
jgi:hypothetical protein